MVPRRQGNIPEPLDEITVKDGHLTIKLVRLKDSWYADIESNIEGKIFSGRVSEMSELLVSSLPVDAFTLPGAFGDTDG